jgi:4-hydroxy-2-oxoheptanedioate aldolase
MVAESGGVPIVRVPEGNHHYIKRALDAGAWGIMVPMVDTVEQARLAIAATKYPPQGNRSVGSYLPMMSFDATTEEYLERANDELLVVLQIESPQGIRNLEGICQLPGCDVVFIGAYDLWQNLPPTAQGKKAPREELEAAIDQILAIAHRFGKPVGIYTLSAEEAARRQQQGMLMASAGSDVSMLGDKAAEVAARLQLVRRGAIGKY